MGNEDSLTVEEAKNLLLEEYGNLPREVGLPFNVVRDETPGPLLLANFQLDGESLDEDWKDMSRSTREEEKFYARHMDAEEAEPLKDYLKNPSEENLNQLKISVLPSGWGFWKDPELSPIGISYLKEVIEENTKAYEDLLKEEKVFNTSEEVWEKAVNKLPEDVRKSALNAPEDPTYDEGGYVKYIETLKLEGEPKTLVDTLVNNCEELLESIEEEISSPTDFGEMEKYLGALNNFGLLTAEAGRTVKSKRHLEENGIDEYVGFDEPLYFLATREGEEKMYLRFFEKKDNVMTGSERPGSRFKDNYKKWRDEFIDMGYSVQQKHENFPEEVRKMGASGWKEVKSVLRKVPKYLEYDQNN